MKPFESEASQGQESEQISQTPLIECKYPEDGDVFIFITLESIEVLTSGKTLKTTHPETGANFTLRYDFILRNGQELEVSKPTNPNKGDLDIRMSESGCFHLLAFACCRAAGLRNDARLIASNVYGAPDSRVNVILDEEMVQDLARTRAKAKNKKPLFEDRGLRNGYRITVMNPEPVA